MKYVPPVVVFSAFMALFTVAARRRGMGVREYMASRRREIVLQPGWWRPFVVITVAMWLAFWAASGFRPILLVTLPVFVGWIPFWGTVWRGWYRRRDATERARQDSNL